MYYQQDYVLAIAMYMHILHTQAGKATNQCMSCDNVNMYIFESETVPPAE